MITRRFRVHPAIGVARVGDAPNEFFIGPEQPGVPPNWDPVAGAFRSFRDSTGRVKRQGARFRVFEYAQGVDGQLVPKEILPGKDGVKAIEWRVHLANRKGSFFTFNAQSGADDFFLQRAQRPGDAHEKGDTSDPTDPPRTNRRNSTIRVDREANLDIDPGELTISGADAAPVVLLNQNPGIPIPDLGVLRTDDLGRLIVLGGHGISRSSTTPPSPLDEYANNDTWFDDVGDGSVKARVILDDGTHLDADAAWVLVGPPDFAPAVGNVVSLYDTLWDIAVRSPEVTLPSDSIVFLRDPLQRLAAQRKAWDDSSPQSLDGYRPSFTREVYPILSRAVGARGVHVPFTNHDFHTSFDWAALADARDGRARSHVFDRVRDPRSLNANYGQMPRGLGDHYDDLDDGHATARSFLSLTHVQYAVLQQWASGEFESDWLGSDPQVPAPLAVDPEGLDRSAIENCVGGPFYPGIEVSWLVRATQLYSEAFRLRVSRRPIGEAEDPRQPTIGAVPFRAGFFSQQMAQPWQADFYDCHKELHQDPMGVQQYYMWWTAQRPDDVTPKGSSAGPVRWVRGLDLAANDPKFDEASERFVRMVENWGKLGFVIRLGDQLVEDEAL